MDKEYTSSTGSSQLIKKGPRSAGQVAIALCAPVRQGRGEFEG
jgi:hypothetical protein